MLFGEVECWFRSRNARSRISIQDEKSEGIVKGCNVKLL